MDTGPIFPLLVFDGDCAFCRLWVDYLRQLTNERVRAEPYQEVAEQFPQIPLADFEKSVRVIEPTGEIAAGAEAIFRVLAIAPGHGWPFWLYRHLPGFAAVSEATYAFIARHRGFFYGLTRLSVGAPLSPPSYVLISAIFLRIIALVYLIAFVSLAMQILGLVGAHGILPAGSFLDAVHNRYGDSAYWRFPTLAWLDSGDGLLLGMAIAGATLSVVALVVGGPTLAFVGLWALYLSLAVVGQDFLNFQWDALLLETGLLAIFLASFPVRKKGISAVAPSTAVIWLLRLLLFRVMFSSGVKKLATGDPTWRNLTALNFHFLTQPLPTPVGWYAYQLPNWMLETGVVGMFGIELVAPFFILGPRRLRFVGAALIALLQILIGLTGNYTFFNLLTLALCLPLLDDALVRRILRRPKRGSERRLERFIAAPLLKQVPIVTLSLLMLYGGGVRVAQAFTPQSPLPDYTTKTFVYLDPFRAINAYGLFSVMTTSRPEIVVEGSNDRQTWMQYEFKDKPGDTSRAPPWVEPLQPRLDWQMWFASLGSTRDRRWFANFVTRLLQGSPDVLGLLSKDPFPNAPPRYVRALFYDYDFTDWNERKSTGQWWRRELKGLYYPTTSLR